VRRQKLVRLLRRKGLSHQRANDLIDDIIDGIVSDMTLIRLTLGDRRAAKLLKKAALSIGYFERGKGVGDISLEEFFGPKPLDLRIIRRAFRGARAVMIHLSRNRVTKLALGARRDKRLPPIAEEHVLRAFREKGYNFIVKLLPRVGRSSAQLRVIP
jgi:hypothetical protein